MKIRKFCGADFRPSLRRFKPLGLSRRVPNVFCLQAQRMVSSELKSEDTILCQSDLNNLATFSSESGGVSIHGILKIVASSESESDEAILYQLDLNIPASSDSDSSASQVIWPLLRSGTCPLNSHTTPASRWLIHDSRWGMIPQKIGYYSQWHAPITATFSERRKIGSI